MINLRQIFTWWHKQTIGTSLKTLLSGQFVGKDQYGNKYYKNKSDKRWVVYKNNIEASKITSEWFLWMHHTTNDLPKSKINYLWQKKHLENQTGTSNSFKPSTILKSNSDRKKYETWNN